jgi:hypothetical protein
VQAPQHLGNDGINMLSVQPADVRKQCAIRRTLGLSSMQPCDASCCLSCTFAPRNCLEQVLGGSRHMSHWAHSLAV